MTTQRWIIVGVVLAGIFLLISEHNGNSISGTGTRPCTVTVTADLLNVRSSPEGNAPVVDSFAKGVVVSAGRTISNGFRQLGPNRWAAQEFLDPTADSDCG